MQINAKPASEKISSVTIDGVPHSKCKKVEITPIAGMADPAAEIAAMRKAIREAHDTLEKVINADTTIYWPGKESLPTKKEGDCAAIARSSLSKLQPFLKP